VNTALSLASLAAGLLFGLSLIVVLGVQNLFVLRQGALCEHVGTVVAVCSISDVVLIGLGVGGAGAVLAAAPALMSAVRIGGATVLLAYGGLAARRSLRAQSLPLAATPPSARASVLAATIAITWLNPAVYLDTVVLLGSVANARPGEQWWFGLGSALASVLWFAALGYGARLLGPLMGRPKTSRLLDGLVAVVMAFTAARVLVLR
jgi:L-lysine exporter family protein LysE/ArgO